MRWPFLSPDDPEYRAPSSIEARAYEYLSAGLESGRMTAVIGAGCSLAYGRVSWSELVKNQYRETAKRVANARGERASPLSVDPDLEAAYVAVNPTIEDFDPNLPNLLDLTRTLDEVSDPIGGAKAWLDDVTAIAKDDRGHARLTLLQGYGVAEEKEFDASLWRLTAGARPELPVHRIFTREVVEATVAGEEGRLGTFLADRGCQGSSGDKGAPVAPLRRYILAAALRLGGKAARARALDHLEELEPPGEADHRRREDIVPETRDPLKLLTRRLGVIRYMTTNYDHEIERMFEDEGYGRPLPDNHAQPWARTFDLFVFGADHAPKLIDFAAKPRGRNGIIAYLHGRVPDRETDASSLIITERDYQKFYLEDQKTRELMDAAMDTAFSASPLLFIGSNMSEGDVLRPLRRMLSQGLARGERPAVALLPGWGKGADRVAEQQQLLTSHGVHALYYGAAIRSPPSSDAPSEVREVDWLYGFKQEIIRLKDWLKRGTFATRRAAYFRPTYFEGRQSSSDLQIDFELDLVENLSAWMSDSSGKATHKAVSPSHHEREAALILLDGALNAVTSACSCAKLIEIEQNWRSWKSALVTLPRPRVTWEAQPDDRSRIKHQRHALALPELSELPTPGAVRFYLDSPCLALHDLLHAMQPSSSGLEFGKGRRFLTLVARRGLGKGHFFSSLEFAIEAELNGDASGDAPQLLASMGTRAKHYSGRAFLNLSFAHEVMSVFDRLTEFLKQSLECATGMPIQTDAAWKALRNDRVAALRSVLTCWSRYKPEGKKQKKRVLVAINAIGILFDKKGEAKNGQVWRLFDLIFGNDFRDAPIDWIFVCDEGRIPAPLRRTPTETLADASGGAIRTETGDQTKSAIVTYPLWPVADGRYSTAHALNVLKRQGYVQPLPSGQPVESLLHVLRGPRASLLLLAYFPRVALLWAYDLLPPELKVGPDELANVFEPYALEFRKEMKSLLASLYTSRLAQAGEIAPVLTVTIATLLTLGAPRDLDRQSIEEVLRLLHRAVRRWPDGDPLDAAVGVLERVLAQSGLSAPDNLKAMLQVVCKRYDQALKGLYEELSGSRYLITLVCSTAYEMTTELTRFDGAGSETNPRISRQAVNDAARDMTAFLTEVRAAIQARRAGRAHEIVIPVVHDRLRRLHEAGRPLPFDPGQAIRADLSIGHTSNLALYALQRTCLWHLSIIGEPVQADVLVSCPDIAAAVDDWAKSIGRLECDRLELLRCALELAVYRSLAFKLKPVPGRSAEYARYAVHRLIQRDVLRNLGTPGREFADVDQFTLTIYASQPDHPATIAVRHHASIRKAIEALADYAGRWGASDPAIVADFDALDLQSRRLRAAFSVVRTIYSIGTLSSLAIAEQDAGVGIRSTGRLEHHRRLLWWFIRQAQRLSTSLNGLDTDHRASLPFFAEEIVWLYNEMGVISLVQGRLAPAYNMFEIALSAAQEIELDESGALHTRISLNRAIVAIERGQFDEAWAELSPISLMTSEHYVPPLLAKGYLGLISQFRGDAEAAATHFGAAIKGLRDHERNRALAIFTRHLGDLKRVSEPAEAGRLLDTAQRLATRGGHIDIQQLGELSRLRLDIGSPDAEYGAIIKQLDRIEGYARFMDAPRLDVSANLIRARVLKRQGDPIRAAIVACRAHGASAAYDMRLRNERSEKILKELLSDGLESGDK